MKLDRDIVEAHKQTMIAKVLPILESNYHPAHIDIKWREIDKEDHITLSMTIVDVRTDETIIHQFQNVFPLYG